MERPSPEPLDARGLKTPTSDRAKRFLLNSFLKSAEACSLLTPVQKEECSLLHLFPITFPHAPYASYCTVALSQKYPNPLHSGRFKYCSPISLLSCLENNPIFAANLGISAFYLASHCGMVQYQMISTTLYPLKSMFLKQLLE